MSARQPFKPASRPASAQMKDTSLPADPPNFAIDLNNPPYRDSPQSSKPPAPFMTNRPLNLSNFANNGSKSFEKITRPGTADIHGQSRSFNSNQSHPRKPSGIDQLKIAAPIPSSPFNSNTSAMFSTDDSAFKRPTLPQTITEPSLASADDATRTLTLAPTPELVSGVLLPTVSHSESQEDALVSFDSALEHKARLRATDRSRALEHVREHTIEFQKNDPPGFGSNTPRASEGGPLRVLANSRLRANRRSSLENATIDYQNNEIACTDEQKENRTILRKRDTSERFDDEIEEDEFVRREKRYKFDIQERIDAASRQEYASPTTEHSARSKSPHSRHSFHLSVRNHNLGGQPNDNPHTLLHNLSTSTLALSPVSNQPVIPQDRHQVDVFDARERYQGRHDQFAPPESAFNKILGEDVESYIAEQAEVYENVQKKWEEATFEEWVSGADELAESFAKLLDLVKGHMTTKMKLYANLDQQLEAHTTVLQVREQTLAQAKGDLLRNGGTLLAGSGAT